MTVKIKNAKRQAKAEKRKRLFNLCREDGGCMIWQGSLSNSGHPVIGGKTARRVMWETNHEKLTRDDIVTCTCGRPLCLLHLALTTKGEVIKKTWERTDVRSKRIAANEKQSRQRAHVVMSMEKAREVRASDKSDEELAKFYGCHRDTIANIRSNRYWKEPVNPFSGLLASNSIYRKTA